MSRLPAALLLCCALLSPLAARAATAQKSAHAVAAPQPLPAIAISGQPKYQPGFTHLDYVNPGAPKGGTLRLARLGTFDSLNPFVLKSTPAPGLQGLVYQTLMAQTADEPLSEYGLIAKTVEVAPDKSWVVFTLRKSARWNDGTPITSADVVWTFNTLMKDGAPFFRVYYAAVKSAAAEGPLRVKFTFRARNNHELPMIVGGMPVLPEHYWKGKDFAATTTLMPLGSGPYKVKSVKYGRRIVYERVKNWWAKDLPIEKGQYNFDTISYDMYQDATVILQGLFAGEYDLHEENIAKSWYTEYDKPAVNKGYIKKELLPNHMPQGMQAFIFNIRRPMFKNRLVREALGYTFDFAWSNKQFAWNSYKRTTSYFENSEFASSGVPEGQELKILEPFKKQLPPELFTKPFTLPQTSGNGYDMRQNLITAANLLKQAGWKVNAAGVLEKDGKPFKFEFLIYQAAFARWLNPMVNNLKRLGIQASIRQVDVAQYQKRMEDFDFDMAVGGFGESLSPGNEQRNYWGSAFADVRGSSNLIGIKNPVVDKLVDMIVHAPDRAALIVRTRALDRVLLWNYYVIPNWYLAAYRVAYWNKFDQPQIAPKYAGSVTYAAIDTWWYDPQKAAKIPHRFLLGK